MIIHYIVARLSNVAMHVRSSVIVEYLATMLDSLYHLKRS